MSETNPVPNYQELQWKDPKSTEFAEARETQILEISEMLRDNTEALKSDIEASGGEEALVQQLETNEALKVSFLEKHNKIKTALKGMLAVAGVAASLGAITGGVELGHVMNDAQNAIVGSL